MAKKIYNEEELELQDGTEVTIKPLVIGRLRRFMDAWKEISEVPEGDDGFNVFINCSGIALEDNFKEKYETLRASVAEKKKGEHLSTEYREYLEEVLDLETIYKILEVAGGIKLNDPKLMEQIMEQQAQENQR